MLGIDHIEREERLSDPHIAAAGTAPRRFTRTIVRSLPVVARILMGALFLFAGGVGLLASPTPPPGLSGGALAFNAALKQTGYMLPLVSVTQAVVGLLLLSNRCVPLALAMVAPVVVNIVAYHAVLERTGLGIAVIVAALEVYLAWQYRDAYRPMLAVRAAAGASPALPDARGDARGAG